MAARPVIGLPALYALTGAMFAGVAVLSVVNRSDNRYLARAAFWGLLAVEFLAGGSIGDVGNGLIAVALAVLGGAQRGAKAVGSTGSRGGARHIPSPTAVPRPGAGLILIALIVPATALAGTFVLPLTHAVDPKQVTLVALGLGVVLALAVCFVWLRPRPSEPLEAARGILDAVGWAVVLPQALAALGAVFALAGVGAVVGGLVGHVLPDDSRFAAVAAYAVGMAGLTMLLGNAFAAFPVMTAAVALPVLVGTFHGDAAPIAAIGMLSGFCGTLLTPMAANYNIVPATLLGLDDRYGVIKAQIATALPLLAFNTLLMNWVAFR